MVAIRAHDALLQVVSEWGAFADEIRSYESRRRQEQLSFGLPRSRERRDQDSPTPASSPRTRGFRNERPLSAIRGQGPRPRCSYGIIAWRSAAMCLKYSINWSSSPSLRVSSLKPGIFACGHLRRLCGSRM